LLSKYNYYNIQRHSTFTKTKVIQNLHPHILDNVPMLFWHLPQFSHRCYGTLWTLTFFFFFYLFFLILYFFSFEFLFLFLFSDNEEAHDIAVTWHVTWCDVIGLEHSKRIWKMTSEYMYTIWWPWVRNEVDMRM